LGNSYASYALTVLDLRTGRLDWMGGVVGSGASRGQVVIVGPEVVALADDTASAFAASGGRPLWRHAAPAGCDWGVVSVGATSSEITLGDATVFPYECGGADSDPGGIARLAPATGATIWQRRLPSAPLLLAQAAGSVAVIHSTGLSNGAVAQVFDVATGRMRFSTTIFATEEYTGMLAVDRTGNVYALAAGPAESETLVCVDGADSRVLWSVPLGHEYLALSVGVVGGQVVLGGLDTSPLLQQTPELRLFSAATGTQLAQHSTAQFTYSVMSGWDSAFALEPGLAVVGVSRDQDVLGAVSLPQLTGTS
jgi:outer membrane protein assembly factor BamB